MQTRSALFLMFVFLCRLCLLATCGNDDDAGNGRALGIDEKFAYNIVKQVGNYGEVFERHLGAHTALGIERGLNALWTEGGLLYSAPFK